jgi:reversibly glycosylated polypeptide/UDP-arabinopyranose mutase
VWLWLLQVGEKLNGIDPYFTKLAEAMVTWIEAWTEISAAHKKEAEAEGKVGSVKAAKK